MVICGGNGCGKSALLNALMTAKEYAGSYGGFTFDPGAVSVDAEKATLSLSLTFSDEEREFVRTHFNTDCPEVDEVLIEIQKGGRAQTIKRSHPVQQLLGYFSPSREGSPGFFDYIDAYRHAHKVELARWEPQSPNDEHAKHNLSAPGGQQVPIDKAIPHKLEDARSRTTR